MAALDTADLEFLDGVASAVGGFPQALRGYENAAVDAYVRDVEGRFSRASAQLRRRHQQLIGATVDLAALTLGHNEAAAKLDALVTTARSAP